MNQPRFYWGRPNPNYTGPSRAAQTPQDPAADPMEDTMNQTTSPGSDHYGFTGVTKTLPDGQVVRQIEAAVDMPNAGVSAGDIGGWVAPGATLMEKAWLSPDTMVLDSATLAGNARLGDSAVVCGSATVDGDAFCAGRSRIEGRAHVGGFARVTGDAVITDSARVSGEAHVGGDITLSGTANITGNVDLSSNEALAELAQRIDLNEPAESEHIPVPFRWLDAAFRGLTGRN